MNSLKIFLPQIPGYQIEQSILTDDAKDEINMVPLKQDWQSLFCESVGYPSSDLPWSQLRLAQLNIDHDIAVACCCDPVMMQLTHRGAYMAGQNQLQLSYEDATKVVDQINEKLMREGENLYRIDKHAWLFTSKNKLSLDSVPVQKLIGKDMFNFSYGGSDANYWQQLAMEIQMLLKQMMDYQGLPQPPAEMIMNVHFFDNLELTQARKTLSINNGLVTIISDNQLIRTFSKINSLAHKDSLDLNDIRTPENVLIAFDNDREKYAEVIQFWKQQALSRRTEEFQIICQDAIIVPMKKKGFFERFLRRGNRVQNN